ncbi:DUF2235 domain-containing protein [Pseudomonas sp. JAI115]|uniref:phospholipase effector Tle1 domain-containing protein n=1 Tax=Pseudomonas sp. JAI115 TaxID=2723061 RepID=UPI0016131B04
MPSVCRPANPNPPRKKAKAACATPYEPPALLEEKPVPVKARIRIAVRIGVFFDGTGNNAANSAMGLACGAHHAIKPADLAASCKPYMSDPDSSYANDISNVKKLSDLYYETQDVEEDATGKLVLRKLYLEGIGTTAGAKDSAVGMGTGRGSSGIAARVQQAFRDIDELIQEVVDANTDSEITSLTFDAFGFSRGAAAARHFANEVALGNRGPLRAILTQYERALSRTFLDYYNSDIRIGFIGLFDTVASIGGFSNGWNVQSPITPGVRLHLPRALFSDVVQLVARDEYRANFALNRVSPDHLEITLPGVHSNIGGGYRAEAQESVLIRPMQGVTVAKGTNVRRTDIYAEALVQKAKLVTKGWPDEMLEVVTPMPLPVKTEKNEPAQERVFAGLQLKRPVRGELSRVYLRVMYELAKQKGVKFEVIDEQDPDYVIPAELQPLCDRFVAGDYSVTPEEETMLRLRYIHMSAHWSHPLDTTGQREPSVLYINAPTPDAVRVRHPHVSG